MDLIGIDINLSATKSLYEAYNNSPRFTPHSKQEAMVEAGNLGKKTGKGFLGSVEQPTTGNVYSRRNRNFIKLLSDYWRG